MCNIKEFRIGDCIIGCYELVSSGDFDMLLAVCFEINLCNFEPLSLLA